MEGLAICNIGFEEESIKEIKEILGELEIKNRQNYLFFKIKEIKDLARLTYLSQTLHKIFLITSKENEDLEKIAIQTKDNFQSFLEKDTKIFYKNYFQKSEEKKNSKEKILEFAKLITKTYTQIKYSMENFKTALYLIKLPDEKYISAIDFSTTDLAKRDYRIFNHKNALNSTIASSLFYLTAIKNKINILDPFCGSGTIPIEFALKLERKSPHEFDSDLLLYNNFIEDFDKEIKFKKIEYKIYGYDQLLNNVKSAQKNSKIANINKEINFSKISIDWLDTKFDEKEIDYIITDPPTLSKKLNQKEIDKIYKEFFYQADFILNKYE